MKVTISKTLHLNFTPHMKPLSFSEKKMVFGGSENYGNTTERIRSLIIKLLYGN